MKVAGTEPMIRRMPMVSISLGAWLPNENTRLLSILHAQSEYQPKYTYHFTDYYGNPVQKQASVPVPRDPCESDVSDAAYNHLLDNLDIPSQANFGWTRYPQVKKVEIVSFNVYVG